MYNRDNTKEADDIFMRISSEMKKQNRKQADLIRFLNLPISTYTNWRLGKSRNYCEHLLAIAEFLQVDAGWLLSGEVNEGAVRDGNEKEMLREFRKLSPEKQTAMIQNIKWITQEL